ncbi:hypothetical protein LDL08_25380 [Nonomuraea glycinis]|uniref:Uncharacterized protein n=1 Tax=Nonomuraea glycinis TaxID=2047744 RepID=A0A918E8R8_9ACTN|nr:hypothetical protein [Nonomuraea glycinis]MCA2179525.1 hypothetical protein [Nonomuraea glycinis]GGP15466.1 hypothetical protein GCM10012278_75440 [Nonomuraea glycinis]
MERRRPVEELMTGDFTVTDVADGGLDGAGATVLDRAGFTVLLGVDGEPAGLAGGGERGPACVVEADTPLGDVLDSADLLHALVSGTPGLVIVRGRDVVGVVGAEAIKAEIVRDTASRLVAGRQLGDAQPHGRRATPPPSRIQCKTCGATNTFHRFSQAATYTCQHGDHDFVPYWSA